METLFVDGWFETSMYIYVYLYLYIYVHLYIYVYPTCIKCMYLNHEVIVINH